MEEKVGQPLFNFLTSLQYRIDLNMLTIVALKQVLELMPLYLKSTKDSDLFAFPYFPFYYQTNKRLFNAKYRSESIFHNGSYFLQP